MPDGLAANSVAVGAGATVSAASGLVISSSWGTNTVTNNGTIIGDVILSNGTGPGATFLNQNGATYVTNANGTVDLGTSGSFNNQGTIVVAGAGTFGSTTLTGTLFQASGTISVDVGGSGSSDVFNVGTASKASGNVGVSVVGSLDPNGQYAVMTVCGNNPANCNGSLKMPAILSQMAVTSNSNSGINVAWNTSASTDTALSIAPAGVQLNANQKAYAQHLQASWNAGGSDGLNPVYADLINRPSLGAYPRALGTAMPAILAAGPAAAVGTSRSALGSVLSCPEFQGSGTLVQQGDCMWARLDAGYTSFTPGDYTGFNVTQTAYRLGAQKEVATGWFVGLAASYGLDYFTNEFGYSSTQGQEVGLSASLKREMRPWLFSAAAHLGYGWYDASRQSVIGTATYLSDSNYESYTAAGRLRAEYSIPFQNWYLKPMARWT